jgi:hypothetical protein
VLFLRHFAPHLAISAIVIVAGGLAGLWVKEQGRKEMRPVIERLQTELNAEREHRKRNEAAINDYQSELSALRKRPLNRSPVRLCIDTAVPLDAATGHTAGAAASAGSDDRPTGGDLKAGPDIGAELYALTAACDAEIAKLRALQNWVRQ